MYFCSNYLGKFVCLGQNGKRLSKNVSCLLIVRLMSWQRCCQKAAMLINWSIDIGRWQIDGRSTCGPRRPPRKIRRGNTRVATAARSGFYGYTRVATIARSGFSAISASRRLPAPGFTAIPASRRSPAPGFRLYPRRDGCPLRVFRLNTRRDGRSRPWIVFHLSPYHNSWPPPHVVVVFEGVHEFRFVIRKAWLWRGFLWDLKVARNFVCEGEEIEWEKAREQKNKKKVWQ
jgi:hypothetical protein